MERRTQCGAMRFPASTRRKQAAMRCERCVDAVADAEIKWNLLPWQPQKNNNNNSVELLLRAKQRSQ